MYLHPVSHSRVSLLTRSLFPSSDRTSFTRRSVSPPHYPAFSSTFRTGLSFLSFPLSHRSRVLFSTRAPLPSRRCSFSPRDVPSLSRRARVFSPVPLFFLSTPPGRRVIFIICYLLRHTPPAAAGVSGAAHPEKPENRGKQKRGRRVVHLPAGWRELRTTVGKGRFGGGDRGGWRGHSG